RRCCRRAASRAGDWQSCEPDGQLARQRHVPVSAIVAAAGRPLSERTKRWIAQATAYSAPAGPDRQGIELGPDWGLGHALLATGAEEPAQPLTRDGRVWLAADVRFDARADLIATLKAHRQPVGGGSSDPELLLSAYD